MIIFAYNKAKNWVEERIQTVLKDKKISTLIILILLSGCFFYNQLISISPYCFADDFESEGYLENEREWISKINYFEKYIENQRESQKNEKFMAEKKEKKIEKVPEKNFRNIEEEVNKLVGNAPIREMTPFILKFDQRVSAFIIGIAKKESDWGRHAPSLAGKTCYNYWGYKGQGSRGTSMGYACFGSPEEAVEIVGKRIEKLVAKNINEPRQMLVWKCGSSCAGHDPGGVQKWVSDVNMYFSKVMQIRNS